MASPCIMASPGGAPNSPAPLASPTWTYRPAVVHVRRQVLPTSNMTVNPTTVVVTTAHSSSPSQTDGYWSHQSQPESSQPLTARRLVSAPCEPVTVSTPAAAPPTSGASVSTSTPAPAGAGTFTATKTMSAASTTSRATVPMVAAASAPARSSEGPAKAIHHCIASPTSTLTTTLFCPVVWTPSQKLAASSQASPPPQAPATPILGDRTCNQSLACDSPDASGLGPEVMDAEMSVMDKSVTSVPLVTFGGMADGETIPAIPPLPPDNSNRSTTKGSPERATGAAATTAAASAEAQRLLETESPVVDPSAAAAEGAAAAAAAAPTAAAAPAAAPPTAEEEQDARLQFPIGEEEEELVKANDASTVEFEASQEGSFWEGQMLGCSSSLLHFQQEGVPDEASFSEAETYLESAAQRWRLWNVQKHGDSIGGTCSFEPLPSDILCFIAQLLMEADKAKESKAETDWRLEAEGLQRLCERLAEDLSQVHKAHSESVADALESCRSRDALANELRDAQILSHTLKQENARLTELLASATASPRVPASTAARRTLPQQQQQQQQRATTPTRSGRPASADVPRFPSRHLPNNAATATTSTIASTLGSSANAGSATLRSSRPTSRGSSVSERLFAGSTASSRQRALEITGGSGGGRGSSRSASVDAADRLGQRSNSVTMRRPAASMAPAVSTPRQRQRTDLSSPRRTTSPATPTQGKVQPRMNLSEAISQWKKKELERSAEAQHLSSKRRVVPSPGNVAPSLASSDSASAVIWTPALDRPSRGSSEATIRMGHSHPSAGDVRVAIP